MCRSSDVLPMNRCMGAPQLIHNENQSLGHITVHLFCNFFLAFVSLVTVAACNCHFEISLLEHQAQRTRQPHINNFEKFKRVNHWLQCVQIVLDQSFSRISPGFSFLTCFLPGFLSRPYVFLYAGWGCSCPPSISPNFL